MTTTQEALLYTVVAVNLATLAAFGIDKWNAKKGRRRIPEARLLFLAWATGLFGAWIGVRLFRHKSAKPRFLARLGLVTVLNWNWLLLFLWLSAD